MSSERTRNGALYGFRRLLADRSSEAENPLEAARREEEWLSAQVTLSEAVRLSGELIARLSKPTSRLMGRIMSVFGLGLVTATMVLGIIDLLKIAEFVAAIIVGAVLSIAGPFAITAENMRAVSAAGQIGESAASLGTSQDKADFVRAKVARAGLGHHSDADQG